MKKILALVLSLAMLLTIVGCAQSAAPAEETAEETAEATVTTEETVAEETTTTEETAEPERSSSAILGVNTELVPEYSRPEMDTFYDDCEALAACTDAEEAIALYDELMAEYTNLYTMYDVTYVVCSLDATDEYWIEEEWWCWYELDSASDALYAACSEVLAGPCGEEFRAYVGDETADKFAEYEQADEALQELYDREGELIDEYYVQLDEVYYLPVECDGQEWTLMDIYYSDAGDSLYEEDYDAWWAAVDALDAAANEVLGPIYVELVQVRQQIAALCGYDSYSDYAYECEYGRDYSPDDAAVFCDAFTEIIRRYYEEEYYNSYSYYYEFGELTADELLAALGDHAEQIDPIVAEAWQYMMDNDLYVLTDSENSYQSDYTMMFETTGTSLVYDYLYHDSSYDFRTLCGDFGFFVSDYINAVPDPLTSTYNDDLYYFHADGLAMLYTAFYDDIHGEDADAARHSAVENLMDLIVNSVIYDEFQRRVYALEDITLEDINRIYSELIEQYSPDAGSTTPYNWMYYSKNYDNPLFSICYAVSAVSALQIWQLAGEDYDAAVDMWLAVVNESVYDKGTEQVMTACGMASLKDTEAIYAVCNAALEYLIGLNG